MIFQQRVLTRNFLFSWTGNVVLQNVLPDKKALYMFYNSESCFIRHTKAVQQRMSVLFVFTGHRMAYLLEFVKQAILMFACYITQSANNCNVCVNLKKTPLCLSKWRVHILLYIN